MNKATAVPNKSLKKGPFCQGLAQDDRIKITHPSKNDPDKSPFPKEPKNYQVNLATDEHG